VSDRLQPPADIEPEEFFLRWVPRSVRADEVRRRRLGDTRARLVFDLTGPGGGTFTLFLEGGQVEGRPGDHPEADLRIQLDVATWRELNGGSLSAPEAFLARRVRLQGNLMLAVKLHLILG